MGNLTYYRVSRSAKCFSMMARMLLAAFLLALNIPCVSADVPEEPCLLFHLSGDKGFIADFARGKPEPSFISDVDITSDGATGPGFRCANTQVMAYWAPGNIYAERGTLAFFWRSRDPVGTTAFPIFRVSYSDHSSWDMVWLRIDYNCHGFDAFVTDANLARARVSYRVPVLPEPDQWLHLALAWDETQGVRFYIDGALVGRKDTIAVFYTGLDQFGPHSRIISPYQVQSMYNFERGGDVDEIRIYDQMLSPKDIARLAEGRLPVDAAPMVRDLRDDVARNEWWLRYGWNRPGDVPPYLEGRSARVRKVEIHDAYDLKQWYWKATDGIRETTWPGVYNRSRIAGRNDYFQLPDWNCYSGSGKSVTFNMPDEPWNHLEISGAAFGSLSLLQFDAETQDYTQSHLFDRPENQERTFHRIERPVRGGKVRFDNEIQETPIGEFSVYHVTAGMAPEGVTGLSYTLTGNAEPDNLSLQSWLKYINRRYLPDERSIMLALPDGAPQTPRLSAGNNSLPLVHILIPFDFRKTKPGGDLTSYSYTWENLNCGLDGIAIDLPPMDVGPTHGDLFPLNIQVRDPIWPARNLLDFTFSVKPGEAKTLWLDTRDRVLPNDYSLYMTIAGAGPDFGPHSLEGARLRLVFKERKEAIPEHEIDRFTQVRDNYAHSIEEFPSNKNLRLYNRFHRDITDLFRVNPDHVPGRYYWSDKNPEQGWPDFKQPKAPPDKPLWAFRQIENLKLLKQFVNWWIDNRQIENGEFGGGLSDDGDLTNLWPGAALMGVDPQKITDSVSLEMEAFYDNGMFTNGLNTILTDELHAYEEGCQVLPQLMLLKYGDPKVVERLMETARAYDRITGMNKAGHLHVRSNYFSGTQVVEEGIWQWSKALSYLIFHPGMALVEFNGNPETKELLIQLADGLIAHRKRDFKGHHYTPVEINFLTDEDRKSELRSAIQLFWAVWRWTGQEKYLLPITDALAQGRFDLLGSINADAIDLLDKRESWGRHIASSVTPRSADGFSRHVAWQVTGDKRFLEQYYADQIQTGTQRMYLVTEGHWWTDRVAVASTELQRSRLGGVAFIRYTSYPGHVVSWDFKPPATAESVAILTPKATTAEVKVIAYNLESEPVTAVMTAWDLAPGQWEITTGVDFDGDDDLNTITSKRTVTLERGQGIEFVFEPNVTTIAQLKLRTDVKPLWERPDLGIGPDDISIQDNKLTVKVHSLGSIDAPPTSIALRGKAGEVLSSALVPAIKAPLDLMPKTADVTIQVPEGKSLSGCEVCVDPDEELTEITRLNNSVVIP